MKVPVETIETQHRATDPEASAFVAANAGSGKTFVLTRRVMRLLLAGADPGRILCLTFTKAAAAEMANRVFDELGRWATIPDDKLAEEITSIEGAFPTASRLARARRLFALALETPGGLKVQTIHAFCEALLQRFTVEAMLPPRFSVIDDRMTASLRHDARDAMLREAASAPGPLADALAHLLAHMADQTIDEAVSAILSRRDAFRSWIRSYESLDAALADLPRQLGAPVGAKREDILTQAVTSADFPPAFLSRLIDVSDGAGITAAKMADAFREAVVASDPTTKYDLWSAIFLTKERGARKAGAIVSAVEKALPGTKERFEREAARQVDFDGQLAAFDTAERTAALSRVADVIIGHYEAAKRATGSLDYDDLIARTADLLSRSDSMQWVQYKLDQGLDHVLVDEAQDTNPRQWEIVSALTGDFFSGAGARPGVKRTVFAVGDAKQSIYSFQGAAPHLFAEMRERYKKLVGDAQATFHDLKLRISFRSTADVVKAVDKVFAVPEAHQGLAEDGPTVHETVRGSEPGLVEVWPEMESQTSEEPANWEDPVDKTGSGSPDMRLANRIADVIAGWMKTGERLASDGKRIRPGDILVLVRKRGAFVEALNRALKQRQVAVAGADRLDVINHIVIRDLVAAAAVALLPEDDLTLASVARSPLVNIGEEELFNLAHGRTGTLWDAVGVAAEAGNEAALRLRDRVETWIDRARRRDPFEFFAAIVGEDGGRAAWRARFGREADEVLDEFLSIVLTYMTQETGSLTGLLSRLSDSSENVKREMDGARNEVRVMTVHGAKGLEAPVVFLVDPGSAPTHGSFDPKVIRIEDAENAPFAWVGGPIKPQPVEAAIARHRQTQDEEYRRLLYVGLTRAKDRLIVCGIRRDRTRPEGRWYTLVASALGPESEQVVDSDGKLVSLTWRHGAARPPAADVDDAMVGAKADRALPTWLFSAPPQTRRQSSLAPSLVLQSETVDRDAAARGDQIHLLLAELPALPRAIWAETGRRLGVPDDLVADVMRLLDEPALAHLFGPASRAEVPVAGMVRLADGTERLVTGRIDRVVDLGSSILLVDYKTNRRVPAVVPDAYVTQMALYQQLYRGIVPGRPVSAAILWTSTAELVPLDQADLDRALAASRQWQQDDP